MKKIKLIIAVALLFTVNANAQITKGNWMVGGNAGLNYIASKDNNNTTVINLSPNIGYFILDKFAIGTLLNYDYEVSKSSFGTIESESTNLGPFLRYYFFKKDAVTNIFLEPSYNFSLQNENKNTVLSSKVGSVIFLNSSVGLEISLKYSKYNFKYSNSLIPDSTSNHFMLGFGLQIHLEK